MVLPYFMGKTAAELVMDTLLPMGYLLVSYWMVRFLLLFCSLISSPFFEVVARTVIF